MKFLSFLSLFFMFLFVILQVLRFDDNLKANERKMMKRDVEHVSLSQLSPFRNINTIKLTNVDGCYLIVRSKVISFLFARVSLPR